MKASVLVWLIVQRHALLLGADASSKFILPSSVSVCVTEAVFHNDKFKLEGCLDETGICRINGRAPFGVAFGLPKTYVKSITISFHGKTYSLDVSNMYNAWGDRPLEYPRKVRYFGGKCFDVANCQFRGLFSDASGFFVPE